MLLPSRATATLTQLRFRYRQWLKNPWLRRLAIFSRWHIKYARTAGSACQSYCTPCLQPIFAIWDQRVANAAFGKAHRYQVNDLSIYSGYSDWIRSARIDNETLKQVCDRLALNPSFPSLRPKEVILFAAGRLGTPSLRTLMVK
jgi:hypothetical protein